jgi:hypothetical protein
VPGADPDFDAVYAIRPQSAMMWRLADYEASQRRWSSGALSAGPETHGMLLLVDPPAPGADCMWCCLTS